MSKNVYKIGQLIFDKGEIYTKKQPTITKEGEGETIITLENLAPFSGHCYCCIELQDLNSEAKCFLQSTKNTLKQNLGTIKGKKEMIFVPFESSFNQLCIKGSINKNKKVEILTIEQKIPTATPSFNNINIKGSLGLKMDINGELIHIGRTGIYEMPFPQSVTYMGFIIEDIEKENFILNYQY